VRLNDIAVVVAIDKRWINLLQCEMLIQLARFTCIQMTAAIRAIYASTSSVIPGHHVLLAVRNNTISDCQQKGEGANHDVFQTKCSKQKHKT
jgi:hypothetical protein